MNITEIAERSGTAFRLKTGDTLTVIDPRGEQVADLLAYNAADIGEVISSGRTLDYAETIRLTTGHSLYSNRSRPMLEIVEGRTTGFRNPSGPDAAPFLGLRASMTDEAWIGMNDTLDDTVYFDRFLALSGLDLRPTTT